jgi:hypothetical protein
MNARRAITPGKAAGLLALGALLGAPSALATESAGAAAVAEICATPPSSRPPDPRCHEALDGRAPAPVPLSLAVPRLVLGAPRLVSRAVMWPVVRTSDAIEYYRVPGWMNAILTTDDGRVGVRPELQYSTGFVSTIGARVFYRRLPGAGSQLHARANTGGSSAIFGELGLQAPALGLAWRAYWQRRRDRLFAGIGPASESELRAQGRGLSRYAADVGASELGWRRRLAGPLSFELGADLQHAEYRADQARGGDSVSVLYGLAPDQCVQAGLPAACVNPALVPGFDEGLRIAHLRSGLALELLSRARDGGGLRLAVDGSYAEGIAGDPSRHVGVTGETLVAIGGNDRVLLLRVQGAMVEALTAAPVPFDELVSPSGSEGMRGFPAGRFRGESGLVGTSEYRWFIAHNLDASLFADVGTVAGPRFSGLRDSRLFPSFGLGLRLFDPSASYWRADVQSGIQIAYAPGAGFSLLLSVAPF